MITSNLTGVVCGNSAVSYTHLDVYKRQVLELLESLSAISEENAASTQQTSASMIKLSNIVEECTEKTAGLLTLSTNLRDNTTKFSIDVIKDNINDMKL